MLWSMDFEGDFLGKKVFIPGFLVAEPCLGFATSYYELHSERRGGIATAPPLRRSYSDSAVMSPGCAFQTDTNLANHRHRTRLLADCQ